MDNKIIQAAIEAGQEIMKVYESGNFEIEQKDDESPLTLADKKAHDKIMHYLKDSEYPVISEESKDALEQPNVDWSKFWLIDPLDGTKEFIKKNGEFTVNIAFIDNHVPTQGVVYAPVQKKLYFTRGGKSYSQENVASPSDFDESKAQELQKRDIGNPIVVVASKSHMNPETQQAIDIIQESNHNKQIEIVNVGSSLKFCLVAEGKADFYPRYAPTMAWDTAAGHAICRGSKVPVIQAKTKQELIYNATDLQNPWFEVGQWKEL